MSALTVARTTLLRASRRPSTYVIAALSFLPSLVAAAAGALGRGALDWGAALAVALFAPLLVAAMVAGPVGESFESRTVVYWFTRPFPRAMVLVGDALAYALVAGMALGLSGALLAGANAITGTADLASLARIPLGMALEAVALVGFSVAAGALAPKHPIMLALVPLAVNLGALLGVSEKLAYVSVGYHASVVAALPYASLGDVGAPSTGGGASVAVSVAVLAAHAVLPLAVAGLVVGERDVR